MELWMPVVISIVGSISAYFLAITKSKSDLKVLEENHKRDLERLEREQQHELKKLEVQIEKETEQQEKAIQNELAKDFMGSMMSSLLESPQVKKEMEKALTKGFKK